MMLSYHHTLHRLSVFSPHFRRYESQQSPGWQQGLYAPQGVELVLERTGPMSRGQIVTRSGTEVGNLALHNNNH